MKTTSERKAKVVWKVNEKAGLIIFIVTDRNTKSVIKLKAGLLDIALIKMACHACGVDWERVRVTLPVRVSSPLKLFGKTSLGTWCWKSFWASFSLLIRRKYNGYPIIPRKHEKVVPNFLKLMIT